MIGYPEAMVVSRAAQFVVATTFALVLLGCTARDDSLRLTQAQFATQTPAIENSTLEAPLRLPQLPREGWSTISLPDVMQRPDMVNAVTNADLARDWSTRWYRFTLQELRADRRIAVYIPRYHPTIGRIAVYANGIRLDLDERQGWNSPFFALLPLQALSEIGSMRQNIDLVVALSLVPRGGGSLSPVYIGPAEQLEDRYRVRRFLQITAPQIASASFLLIGIFACAFWWYRRSAIADAWFAVLAAANFVRSLRYTFSDPLFLNGWFWWGVLNASGIVLIAGHFLAARVNGRRYPRFERALIWIAALTAVTTLVIPLLGILPHTIAPAVYVTQYLVGIAVLATMAHGALKTRRREGMMIVVAQVVWYVVSVHDGLVQNWGRDIEGVFLVPYGALLLLATFVYAILRRYLAAVREAEHLNQSLESALAERSLQLETTHAKLRAVEREQAVLDERQRLMREMHDGLGSSLMSSLALVETGGLDSKSVAQTLRESIDDLKLTIDSLEPIGHDLTTLLGTLRYRLGKRLELAGLTLEWHVGETPRLEWLNPTSALQILRILQEALTNVLKHAEAKTIRVETVAHADRITVRVTDDGRGFDPLTIDEAHVGRGLRNMQRRASSIGIKVAIESRPGATALTLDLPREQATAHPELQ